MTTGKITKMVESGCGQFALTIEITWKDGTKKTIEMHMGLAPPYNLEDIKRSLKGEIQQKHKAKIELQGITNAKAVLLNKSIDIEDNEW